MKRKISEPTIENILKLFSERLNEFNGESRRGYRKAYSSFQIYLVGNYALNKRLDERVIENWIVNNLLDGLSLKTVIFYLEKISSLYTRISGKLIGGKEFFFKDIKGKLKSVKISPLYYSKIESTFEKIKTKWRFNPLKSSYHNTLIEAIQNYPFAEENVSTKIAIGNLWGIVALKSGIKATIVKGIIGNPPNYLSFLNICTAEKTDNEGLLEIQKQIQIFMNGGRPQWHAMRLRPKVKYEDIIQRFGLLNQEITLPEIFYPCEEIVKRVGRKVKWEGKPVIRDVIFFKERKENVYPLFTRLYDLAWCYRKPGGSASDYATIPEKAMEDFRKTIGILNPDFEIAPIGELKLKPGDKIVVVDGQYMDDEGCILKKPFKDDAGNTIYRVTLMHNNGHWDIGIDARLLKKIE